MSNSDDDDRSESEILIDEDYLSDPKEINEDSEEDSEEDTEAENEDDDSDYDTLSNEKNDVDNKEIDKYLKEHLESFNKAKIEKIKKFDASGFISLQCLVADYISQNGTLIQDMKPGFFKSPRWTICSYALVAIICRSSPFKIFSSSKDDKRIELDFDDETLINVAVQVISKSYHLNEMKSPGLSYHFPHLLSASARLTTDEIDYQSIKKEINHFKKTYML